MEINNDDFHRRAIGEIGALIQEGRHSITLRKVAKLMDCSPGTLINRYGSFDLMLLAFNANTLDQLTQSLEREMSTVSFSKEEDPLFASLLTLSETYLEFALAHPNEWQLLFELRLPDEVELPDWQELRIATLLGKVEHLFAQYSKNSDSCNHVIARTFWSGIHGVVALSLDGKLFLDSVFTPKHLITQMVRQFTNQTIDC